MTNRRACRWGIEEKGVGWGAALLQLRDEWALPPSALARNRGLPSSRMHAPGRAARVHQYIKAAPHPAPTERSTPNRWPASTLSAAATAATAAIRMSSVSVSCCIDATTQGKRWGRHRLGGQPWAAARRRLLQHQKHLERKADHALDGTTMATAAGNAHAS